MRGEYKNAVTCVRRKNHDTFNLNSLNLDTLNLDTLNLDTLNLDTINLDTLNDVDCSLTPPKSPETKLAKTLNTHDPQRTTMHGDNVFKDSNHGSQLVSFKSHSILPSRAQLIYSFLGGRFVVGRLFLVENRYLEEFP